MTQNDREEYGDYSVDDEDQLEPEDTLADDDVDDELDRGYSPPERYSAAQRWGNTPWEEEQGEPLDMRLAEEEPEPDPYAESEREGTGGAGDVDDVDDDYDDGQDGAETPREVGDRRAGRLVDPDEGLGEDREKDLYGTDVGIDGAAASAEEAAMHVIDDDEAAELEAD
jgi:hypothetical protein